MLGILIDQPLPFVPLHLGDVLLAALRHHHRERQSAYTSGNYPVLQRHHRGGAAFVLVISAAVAPLTVPAVDIHANVPRDFHIEVCKQVVRQHLGIALCA